MARRVVRIRRTCLRARLRRSHDTAVRALLLGGTLLVAASCAREAGAPANEPPPATRVSAVTDTMHGVAVTDRYRWLEEDTPDVTRWTDAQNRYTRSRLDGLRGRQALEERLRRLIQVGSVTAPIVRANRYFYARRAPSQRLPVVLMREGALGGERALVDPTAFGAATTPVSWLSPSFDGTLLAYGLDQADTGVATLRLLDVDRATLLPDEIPNVLEGIQWLPDNSGFVYHSLKDATDPASRQGLFHQRGTPSTSDQLLYRHVTAAENPRMAQLGGPAGSLSRDGRWFLLSYWLGPESNDLWLAPFDAFRRIGARAATPVSVGVAGRAQGTVMGGTLFLHTTKGAPRGRIVTASAGQPEQTHWREIVPERADTIESVTFGRDTIAVTYLRAASTAIEVFTLDGRPLGPLPLPGLGSASVTTGEEGSEGYVTFSSFNYPPTVFRVDLASPAAALKKWSGVDVSFDPSSIDVRQVSFSSTHGAHITMFLVHRKGLPADGTAPTLLSAYGAFGVSLVPEFSAPSLQWLEAGGVLAVPHVRGGGEYGEAWHRAGMLERKQNGIDDVIAGAEWLIANRYTRPDQLAVHGVAHGAVLAAAAIMERPELFGAAVLESPLLDLLRYHRFAHQPSWIAEYGSADDATQFSSLLRYSPYQRIKAETRYPAVLITAVEGGEVPTVHARKMAAALQAAAGSDLSRPVLLRVDAPPADAASSVDDELRDLVDQRLFLMRQLGMLDGRGDPRR